MVTVTGQWCEDGSATVYGRLMARDGTGEDVAREGSALRKADITSITYAVYDEASPSTAVVTGTVDKNVCVFDTLQTSADDPVWNFSTGFNFRHDLGPSCFPTGGSVYVVEYKFTTTGGVVGWARYRGRASSVLTS